MWYRSTILMAFLTIGGAPVLVGCEEEIKHEEKVRVDGDKTVRETERVTETPDGDLKKTETKEVDRH